MLVDHERRGLLRPNRRDPSSRHCALKRSDHRHTSASAAAPTIDATSSRSHRAHGRARSPFWPDPLVGINPHFERGSSIEALVREGSLHPDTARVFRVRGQPITLDRHQAQAVCQGEAEQTSR
jgi:hypothetical protein